MAAVKDIAEMRVELITAIRVMSPDGCVLGNAAQALGLTISSEGVSGR